MIPLRTADLPAAVALEKGLDQYVRLDEGGHA
jgi:hypothetical protein